MDVSADGEAAPSMATTKRRSVVAIGGTTVAIDRARVQARESEQARERRSVDFEDISLRQENAWGERACRWNYPPKKHRRPILFRGVSGNHPTFKGGVYSGNRFPPPFSGHIGTKRCLARGEPRSQLTVCRMPIALAAACFLRWRMKRLRRPLIGHQRRRTPRKFQGTPRESHVDPATEEESSVCAAYSA